MQTVSEILNLIWMYMWIGIVISAVLILALLRSKVASAAAQTYAIGSLAAFILGGTAGYYSIHFIVVITWGNVIGLFGGYALIILTVVQCYFDRRKIHSHNQV